MRKSIALAVLGLTLVTGAAANENLFNVWWEYTYYPGTSNIWTMKAYPATTNDLSFSIGAQVEYGWTHIEWTSDLKEPFVHVASAPDQHMGIWSYDVYMHTNSAVTASMLESDSGFFRMGSEWDSHIYWIHMENFFTNMILELQQSSR